MGFLVNSTTVKVYLLEEKITKVMMGCRHNQQEFSDSMTPGLLDRAAVINRTAVSAALLLTKV